MGIMGKLGERASRVAKGVSSVATSGVSSGARGLRKMPPPPNVTSAASARRAVSGIFPGPPPPRVVPRVGGAAAHRARNVAKGIPNFTRTEERALGSLLGQGAAITPGMSGPTVGRRTAAAMREAKTAKAVAASRNARYASMAKRGAGGAAVVGAGAMMYRNNKKQSSSGQGLPPGSQTGIYGM